MREYLTIESKCDILRLESDTLRLISYRRRDVPEQDFISFSEKHPTFVIGYLDLKNRYKFLYSYQAKNIETSSDEINGSTCLSAIYSGIGEYDLSVTIKVKASLENKNIYWNIEVSNNGILRIVDVQYPFIVCPYDLGGVTGSEAIVLPHGYGSGKLVKNPAKNYVSSQRLEPDCLDTWEFSSQKGDKLHYPGMQFAQFEAYYNDRAGIYMACNDKAANIKRFAALHRDPGIRLGVAHVGDWPEQGKRALEYDVITCTFLGDWYDAADIYREWSFDQKWFTPIISRNDIPGWLLESPVYVTIRIQGYLDKGSVFPVEEFLPYEKCIPLLETISEKVDSPLCVVTMSWEKAGPWIQPESFPPVGGEKSMKSFISELKKRGWHAGSFCNGTRWVTSHKWNNYDGRDYFDQNSGEKAVCRQADGTMWAEDWDALWRTSYTCCLGSEYTQKMTLDFVEHLIDWGMESLQYLDQNFGSAVFPCFSAEHTHPPLPGKWMNKKMKHLMEEFHGIAVKKGEKGVVQSAEAGANEICLPLFQLTELRYFPPNQETFNIPLYQYLFHECIVIQGMMANAPEPYHMSIKNAMNCVFGQIPGGVMTGDGTFLDKDTDNWAEWEPKIEDSEKVFKMIRNIALLRRGEAKDFLVYGRMLRPAIVQGIKMIEWDGNSFPAVLHSAWRAPDGRIGLVFANWTGEDAQLSVKDERLSSEEIFFTVLSHDCKIIKI